MNITTAQVKDIRTEFAALKPVKIALDGNRSLTVKEAVFALAPTLERMKKRGFDTQEIAEKLHEKGIEIKAPTLAKYLNECRRKQGRKVESSPSQKTDDSRTAAGKPEVMQGKIQQPPGQVKGAFVVKPDTPDGEL